MAESEGLVKLTEYLKQTRRQAEAAIDHLNAQIEVLNEDNAKKSNQLDQAHELIRALQAEIQQLRENSSLKAVYKERDDWKCLVDSIQRDRARLQDENNLLIQKLEESNSIANDLREKLAILTQERDDLISKAAETAAQLQTESVHEIEKEEDDDDHQARLASPSILLSPIIDRRSGLEISFPETSPHRLTQRLKEELRKAHAQVEEERQKAIAAQNAQLIEIMKLKTSLQVKETVPPNPPKHAIPIEAATSASSKDHHAWFNVFLGFFELDSPKSRLSFKGGNNFGLPRILKV
eukprot:gene10103-11183_t